MGSYADHWAEHVASAHLRPTTLSNYRWVLDRHVIPHLGRSKLSRLTPADVRRMLGALLDSGPSARTAQLCHAMLRSMLADAMRDELVSRNVAALVRAPRPQREEVRPWSQDEAARFPKVAKDHRLYALFAVGVGVGLRRGELLGLRWDDVDLEAGLLHVRRTVT